MTDERKTQLRGKGLWQSLPRDPQEPGASIDGWDANLLAAHLDGTLNAQERETLEAKLASEPLLLETLLAAQGGERGEAGPPPELIDAAKAIGQARGGGPRLVRSPANENRRSRVVWLEWAAAAAAVVVVSAIGFELGSESGRDSGKSVVVAAKKGGDLDFDLDGNFFATGFTLDEADDAFNGDE
jgi:hypothetical protein